MPITGSTQVAKSTQHWHNSRKSWRILCLSRINKFLTTRGRGQMPGLSCVWQSLIWLFETFARLLVMKKWPFQSHRIQNFCATYTIPTYQLPHFVMIRPLHLKHWWDPFVLRLTTRWTKTTRLDLPQDHNYSSQGSFWRQFSQWSNHIWNWLI